MTNEKSGKQVEAEEEVTKEVDGTKTNRWLAMAKLLGAVATVLTATTGVVIALWEPAASQAKEDVNKGYEETAKSVNKIKEALKSLAKDQDRLARRIIFFQAWQEGLNAGKLQAENEMLRKANSELKGKKTDKIQIASKLEALQAKFEADQKRREKMNRREKELLKSYKGGGPVQKLMPMPTKIDAIKSKRAE